MDQYLQLISQLAQDLIQIRSQDELSWYVVEEIVVKLGLEDCVVYRFNEPQNKLVQIAAHGEKQQKNRNIKDVMDIPLGQGITGSVALHKKGEIIKDTLLDERYISDLRGMRSEIAVPIIHETVLYGVIDCESSEKGFFKQEHLEFLQIIASMLGARLSEVGLLLELQRHQRALVDSEAKYRSLFERSDDAMMLMKDNKFLMCNEASARMFNYASVHELENIHPSKISPEYQHCGKSSFDKAEEMMLIALSEGYNRFEWVHRKKTGENFFAEVTLTKIPYDGGIGIYAIVRDITEAKNAELAMLDALTAAENANISKSRFLANMSHELRTPLNAIIGFSDAIACEIYGPMSPKVYKSYVQDIHSSGLFLLDLITDLLELSSIDANELEVVQQPISVAKLEQDVSSYIRALLLKNNISFDCHLKNAPEEIIADERALKQIILNLLSNAIKFSPKGSRISLSIEKKPSSVVIIVTDEGIGMDPEVIKNVTKRFDRGNFEPWSTAVEGTGLGLAIVEGLVALHKGTLSIESQVGVGSKFIVTLPQEASLSSKSPHL